MMLYFSYETEMELAMIVNSAQKLRTRRIKEQTGRYYSR